MNRRVAMVDCARLRVHMIGIGGSGMSGAAALLVDRGAHVSGSDLVAFEGMGTLVSRGARVAIGHREQQLDPDVGLVVISAAIPESNPELAAARRRRLRVVKYAELLGMLMGGRRNLPGGNGVAIAGTHGKSTTSAMCVHLFRAAGLDPSFVIGARSDLLGGSSGAGSGAHLIVEACEFDRSFLHFWPRSAAILNVEPDHLDCFGDFDHVVEAFARFAAQVSPDGLLVCNAEDRWAKQAASRASACVETFGFEPGADWQAVDLRSDRGRCVFNVRHHGTKVFSSRLAIPGRHNLSNALAAIALAHHAGADHRTLAQVCPTFTGIARRLSWRGEGRGVTIIDDYAHHPTELRVTLEAVRSRYHPQRIWVVFQPHQHFRTRVFMDEFADSLTLADEVIIPSVYDARETQDRQERDSSEELVSRVNRLSLTRSVKDQPARTHKGAGRARYVPTLDAVADHITRHVTEGDLVLTMGAGDVWKVADELVERFCGPSAAQRADRADDVVSSGRSSAVPVPTA